MTCFLLESVIDVHVGCKHTNLGESGRIGEWGGVRQ